MDRLNILVSVHMITYNHEEYISDAIEGVLKQQTNFKFELIISDDFSTDRTRSIIEKYVLSNNEIINPLYRNKNLGSTSNFIDTFNYCTGKYIALCEGDDYWTDPLKLQKQVDFLEENIEFGLVHGDCSFLYDDGRFEERVNRKYGFTNGFEYSTDILLKGGSKIRTATVLFRSELLEKTKEIRDCYSGLFMMGDIPLWLSLSLYTRFFYMDELFAVYRISPNSTSRQSKLGKKIKFLLSGNEMQIWFHYRLNKQISKLRAEKFNSLILEFKVFDHTYQPLFKMIKPSKNEIFFNSILDSAFVRRFMRIYLNLKYNTFSSLGSIVRRSLVKY